MVAVGWRWWIGTHHHMGRAKLWRVCWVCHGNPWVGHSVHPKALHAPWLLGNWCGNRVPGEGDIEGWLISQRRRVHPPANEEASTAAEQHSHHQQDPKVP